MCLGILSCSGGVSYSSPTKEAGSSMWELPAGVFVMELLMFLFAFEVNDAQDTCTCKCSYGGFRHTGEAASHRRSLQAELPEASPVLSKAPSCVRSDLHPSDPHGKQSHARFFRLYSRAFQRQPHPVRQEQKRRR